MKEKWQQLAPREQQSLIIGAIALIIFIVYVGFYRPLQQRIDRLETDITQQQSLLSWMKPAAKNIQTLRKTHTAISTIPQESILVLTEQSLKAAKLDNYATEVSQTERNKVRIKFNEVPFDDIATWLTNLWKKYALQAIQITATPTPSPGKVKAMVVLTKTEGG